MTVSDLEMKGAVPQWLTQMRAAQELVELANCESNPAEQNKLLRHAVEKMQDAVIAATDNGSQWYRQALQDHFKFRGRNRGRGGVTTEQKVEFLSEFVREHGDPNRPLNPETVALMLSNEWAELARTFWPESHFRDLKKAVRNFANRTEVRSQVFPKRS